MPRTSQPFSATRTSGIFDVPAPSRPPISAAFDRPQITTSGTLLVDHCATARYTLIDYGATASYVPFIGCMGEQPECCPFDPVSVPDVYPRPKDAADATIHRCPTDYYSAFGSCCPNAYTPWTTGLGGVTPCYSTLPPDITPPPADGAIAPSPTRPTVTVTGTVFAMRYAVSDDGNSMPPGRIAGILIGCTAFIAALVYLFRWLRLRRRRRRLAARMSAELTGHYGRSLGSSEVPMSRGVSFRDFSPVNHNEKGEVLYNDSTNQNAMDAAELTGDAPSRAVSRAINVVRRPLFSPPSTDSARTPGAAASSGCRTPVELPGTTKMPELPGRTKVPELSGTTNVPKRLPPQLPASPHDPGAGGNFASPLEPSQPHGLQTTNAFAKRRVTFSKASAYASPRRPKLSLQTSHLGNMGGNETGTNTARAPSLPQSSAGGPEPQGMHPRDVPEGVPVNRPIPMGNNQDQATTSVVSTPVRFYAAPNPAAARLHPPPLRLQPAVPGRLPEPASINRPTRSHAVPDHPATRRPPSGQPTAAHNGAAELAAESQPRRQVRIIDCPRAAYYRYPADDLTRGERIE